MRFQIDTFQDITIDLNGGENHERLALGRALGLWAFEHIRRLGTSGFRLIFTEKPNDCCGVVCEVDSMHCQECSARAISKWLEDRGLERKA